MNNIKKISGLRGIGLRGIFWVGILWVGIVALCFTTLGFADDSIQPLDRTYVKARALNALGTQMVQQESELDAIDVYHQALNLASKTSDLAMKIDIQGNLARVLIDIEFASEAASLIDEAISALPDAFHDPEILIASSKLISEAQRLQSKFPDQSPYTKEALNQLVQKIDVAGRKLGGH